MKENYPHSLQSEQTILGQMLEGQAAKVVSEGVSKDWFKSTENQVIFESIRQVFDSGQDVDALTVSIVLQSNMAKDRIDPNDAWPAIIALPYISILPSGTSATCFYSAR